MIKFQGCHQYFCVDHGQPASLALPKQNEFPKLKEKYNLKESDENKKIHFCQLCESSFAEALNTKRIVDRMLKIVIILLIVTTLLIVVKFTQSRTNNNIMEQVL
jgi:hypothetical protein